MAGWTEGRNREVLGKRCSEVAIDSRANSGYPTADLLLGQPVVRSMPIEDTRREAPPDSSWQPWLRRAGGEGLETRNAPTGQNRRAPANREDGTPNSSLDLKTHSEDCLGACLGVRFCSAA